jgi:hypothetical protein
MCGVFFLKDAESCALVWGLYVKTSIQLPFLHIIDSCTGGAGGVAPEKTVFRSASLSESWD